MINTTSETLLTVHQARSQFPGKPSLPTLWRWILKGVGGAVLESVLIGGRRYTSTEACHRFMAERATVSVNPKQRTNREKAQSYQHSQTVLDHFGI